MTNLIPDHQAEPFKPLFDRFILTEKHLIGEADASVEEHVDLRWRIALHLDSISHQDISADAFEDTAAPKSKEPDEGAKVGRVDVLHVRHRHLFPLLPPHVTPLPQLVASGDWVGSLIIIKLLASYLCLL